MDKAIKCLLLTMWLVVSVACDIKVPKIPNQTDQSNQTAKERVKSVFPTPTVSATAKSKLDPCPGGVSKTKTEDIIVAFSSFEILQERDVSQLRQKLGGPEFPLDSPGCYGVGYAEIIAELMPNRVIIFDMSPFERAKSQRVTKIYAGLLTEFARATGGEWKPKSISVNYADNPGLATINFMAFGKKLQWQVDQHEAINRVGDEFFDGLVRLEQQYLKGVYFNMSRNRQGYFVYVPKEVAAVMQKMNIK